MFRGSSRGGAGKTNGTPDEGNESDRSDKDDMLLVSGETPEEKNLWTAFEKMAASEHCDGRVLRTEWLLHVVMKQELRWDEAEKFLLDN